MFGKTDPQQQWSVHAEFTISHPRVGEQESTPQAHTEQGDNGVRMTYTWTTQQTNNNNWPTASPPPSCAASNRSTTSDASNSYGFQKGNLLFTSTPPRRSFNSAENNRLGVHDSGYGSDLLSPNSFGGGLPHRRSVPQSFNRKCRSTCNIVLSTNIQDENRTEDAADLIHTQCGRTQSLRCQTPTLRCDRKDNFYGCGDPWCHHIHYGDDFSGRFSPVMETCEECPSAHASSKTSRTNTISTVRCGHEGKKDACVQTFEMIDKCTSPLIQIANPKCSNDKRDKVFKKKYSNSERRKTEPIFRRSQSPLSMTPDSLDSLKHPRRIVRSPKQHLKALDKITDKTSPTESKLSDSTRKPRTVHIDVYCTGTEMESDATSSDSTDNESISTPQTVFESEKVRITHKRANADEIPHAVCTPNIIEKTENPKTVEESDVDDGVSTAYPSKMSSCSTIRDFSSSISSVAPSWTTYSMSSCTVPDDYDSIANTSWKDTFSDIDSLLQSRSSIAQTDSLDFVPRKTLNNSNIDETPEFERKHFLETPSQDSIQASDSFEYANSDDRVRIKRMEQFWKNKPNNLNYKSPQIERRHLLQQKKLQDYLDKRMSDKSLPKWESRESDSEASDASEQGWSFVKQTKVSKEKQQNTKKNEERQHSTSKSPSTLLFSQRFSADPTLRAPFAIVPGIYTNPREIAKKFGSIIPVVRKPGHHIGPVKNPDCTCDHCQSYFTSLGYRGRARSVGDTPGLQILNWKNRQPTPSASNKSVPSQLNTDI